MIISVAYMVYIKFADIISSLFALVSEINDSANSDHLSFLI